MYVEWSNSGFVSEGGTCFRPLPEPDPSVAASEHLYAGSDDRRARVQGSHNIDKWIRPRRESPLGNQIVAVPMTQREPQLAPGSMLE